MADEIPMGATAGQLARVVGLTERVIAGRKADGRLPKLPNGQVDLHSLIRAGFQASAERRLGVANPDQMTPEEKHDAGMRCAVMVTAHLVLTRIAQAYPEGDYGEEVASALGEAFEMLGLPLGEAPLPKRLAPLESVG